jgi:hypothetical protein
MRALCQMPLGDETLTTRSAEKRRLILRSVAEFLHCASTLGGVFERTAVGPKAGFSDRILRFAVSWLKSRQSGVTVA